MAENSPARACEPNTDAAGPGMDGNRKLRPFRANIEDHETRIATQANANVTIIKSAHNTLLIGPHRPR